MTRVTLDDVLDASRRDLKSVREDIVTLGEEVRETQERAARQTLTAHLTVRGDVLALTRKAESIEVEQARFHAEQREFNRRILTLIERAVEVPAAPSWFGRVVEWVGDAFSMRPASVRMLVAVGVTAAIVASFSTFMTACSLGAIHTRVVVPVESAPETGSIGGLYP